MVDSIYVAEKLISLNTLKFSDNSTITINGKNMRKGRFCLNKIMYLSNIFYLLLNNEVLMPIIDWQAWENGPVNIIVREHLINRGNDHDKISSINKEFNEHHLNNPKVNNFLVNINDFFKDFDCMDLYEISHADDTFKKTIRNCSIDIKKNLDYYKNNFREAIDYFSNKYGYSG